MIVPHVPDVHPAWLPPEAFRAVGSRRVLVLAGDPGDAGPVATVRAEVAAAGERHGGAVVAPGEAADLVLALSSSGPLPAAAQALLGPEIGAEGFLLGRRDGVTVVLADDPAGLLYGWFEVVRLGEAAFGEAPSGETASGETAVGEAAVREAAVSGAAVSGAAAQVHRPALRRRMLDHWDNIDVHPVMGQVERGYSGGSIFWRDGLLTEDLTRLRAYGRLLAATGVNAVAINNVNVHATEAHLLTDRLGEVAAIAAELRPYGIRVHLSVNFASPIVLGGLDTADPLDEGVREWWAGTTARVYETIPDFGGYVVKADSEGQPGPFAYGRSHADGANMLADALAPHGGVVHWRAFVYDHRQDWRDRSTDRARAAHDHFAPLDGQFRDNAILQVKYGPMDFQTREPISPVIAAMPATRLAVELQVTQEYTGQQRHVCYLGPMWSEVLGFRFWGPGERTVAEVAAGGGLVAVSNVGDDPYWTGHPLAQANLYAFGRLAWAPELGPAAILDEWIGLTFPGAPDAVRGTLHEMMDGSWETYERYTAPLGVGFMVRPGHHYGPDVDGYEYTPWGTYHFADRDGVGVDRTRATGTGYTGQYPAPWSEVYESLAECPDELLLFFHHVPYEHVLQSGTTVVQHIYDTHFAGAEEAAGMRLAWEKVAGSVDAALYTRVKERLDEQVRCAEEWRDQVNTYFLRKSGVPDEHGRRIH
ncbi:alpha-glucuronidase [Nonomuraea gerenzanensis]|uniref:Alpha-glucuronidase n=1 Tax=Nonomuraea gerenzanensis TaxID=93944 RepID=A0A1M4E4Z6_9ACTN|nr:alpha-glucuronidase [Nonomuraea gerenzanensis]UBU16114.1 alpha-glucuronidase [Nonomuraea gerenzanensis]SBO93919.1 Alpha-glucuronidase [Nonomuraea gerenzanensis]